MKFGVVVFPGSNCDHDTIYAFEKILDNDPKDWEISLDILNSIYNTLGLHVKAKIIEEKLHLK